jgi:hypothetical protein
MFGGGQVYRVSPDSEEHDYHHQSNINAIEALLSKGYIQKETDRNTYVTTPEFKDKDLDTLMNTPNSITLKDGIVLQKSGGWYYKVVEVYENKILIGLVRFKFIGSVPSSNE